MDLYQRVSQDISRIVTERYSTSFSMASRVFSPLVRQDIYNIYGFVRIADEIVDSYSGSDALALLNDLEHQLENDIHRGFSTNPVLQAFVLTANKYAIDSSLIKPFMKSMKMDAQKKYHPSRYNEYIYGSAEVIGLMCLKVFCQNDSKLYASLESGARSLGSAFQKVNFLRDLADDNNQLGRYYFPIGTYESFDDSIKNEIISDIRHDFAMAEPAIRSLPVTARRAVEASYRYYLRLLLMIERTPAKTLKVERVRIPNWQKLLLLAWIRVRI